MSLESTSANPGGKSVWINDPNKELDLLAFTGMLSILVNGGLSFGRVFNLLHSNLEGWLRPIVLGLESTVLNDREPLSKAMAKYPEVFSQAYVANVEMGESADLGAVLEGLYRQIMRDLRSESFMKCPCPAALGDSCRRLSEILEMVGSESRALSLVVKTSPNEQVQAAFSDLEQQSLSGIKLAECQLPELFPPVFAGLLAAHDAVGSVPSAFRNLADLLEARSGPLIRVRSSTTPFLSPLHDGEVLQGRYRIEGRLGRGGMGAVYLAFDTETNTQVAVKCFVSGTDAPNPDFQRRFRDEVNILKRLDFPGIPRFADNFEIGVQSYLVMEYIKGLSLSELLDKTLVDSEKPGLPAPLVTRVGIQICTILDHIHRLPKPLIHRDIKPQNIIIRDSDERIFLVDFGLAREAGKNSLVSMVGTAAYAPLEQFQGRPEPRSDLYSLGFTMCELLSGQQPVPLHSDPIQNSVPGLHEDLARILNRARRTLPDERYANAADMLVLLEDALPRLTEPAPVAEPQPKDSSEDQMEQMIRRWGRGKTPSIEVQVPPHLLEASPVVTPVVPPPPPDLREIVRGPDRAAARRGSNSGKIVGAAVLLALLAAGGWWALRGPRHPGPAVPSPTPSSHATAAPKKRH